MCNELICDRLCDCSIVSKSFYALCACQIFDAGHTISDALSGILFMDLGASSPKPVKLKVTESISKLIIF